MLSPLGKSLQMIELLSLTDKELDNPESRKAETDLKVSDRNQLAQPSTSQNIDKDKAVANLFEEPKQELDPSEKTLDQPIGMSVFAQNKRNCKCLVIVDRYHVVTSCMSVSVC